MAAFYHSIDQYGVKYTRYICDGDSATLKSLLNLNPYDVHVQKLECYLHVKNRMGTRCRNLKKQTKGLGGRSKNTVELTDKVINKLQKYYGLAIQGIKIMLMKCIKKFGLPCIICLRQTKIRITEIALQVRIAGAHIVARKLREWTYKVQA